MKSQPDIVIIGSGVGGATVAAGLADIRPGDDTAGLKEGLATLSKFLARLEDEALDRVVAEHEERIIASLKRRGRI